MPILFILIYCKWWFDGPIETRAGWYPRYGDKGPATSPFGHRGHPRLKGMLPPGGLTRDRLLYNITVSINELLVFRDTLDNEVKKKFNIKVIALNK